MVSKHPSRYDKNVPFVLILARRGTSLVVKVALSSVLTIALKHSSVCTLIDRILVLVNRICTVSTKPPNSNED
jgi:hypothetical protein